MYSIEQLNKMSSDELVKIYVKKSVAIRQLFALGYTRSQIANMLNIRYQHVRNTLVQELKTPIVTDQKNESDDQIDLFSGK